MSFNQQNEIIGEVETLGLELSGQVQCTVRFCGEHWKKPVFECWHGVTWPMFALQGAQESGDWSHIIQRHQEALVMQPQ